MNLYVQHMNTGERGDGREEGGGGLARAMKGIAG